MAPPAAGCLQIYPVTPAGKQRQKQRAAAHPTDPGLRRPDRSRGSALSPADTAVSTARDHGVRFVPISGDPRPPRCPPWRDDPSKSASTLRPGSQDNDPLTDRAIWDPLTPLPSQEFRGARLDGQGGQSATLGVDTVVPRSMVRWPADRPCRRRGRRFRMLLRPLASGERRGDRAQLSRGDRRPVRRSSWRARRRHGQQIPEGDSAGRVGAS
jgi:hypothetical protein